VSPDIYPEQFLMSGIFFWLIGWRMLNRRRLGTNAGVLALLAIAASVFMAVLQVGWIWAYQHYEPSEILDIYFTFNPPMWRILGLGLLIALGAFIKRLSLNTSTIARPR
jgi:sulfoxide reductase heme-binding subunit YedZ